MNQIQQLTELKCELCAHTVLNKYFLQETNIVGGAYSVCEYTSKSSKY